MNRKRAPLLVLLCCALVGAFFVHPPQPVRAAWSQEYDFTGSTLSWSYAEGTGWDSGWHNPTDAVYISYSFDRVYSINRAVIEFNATWTGNNPHLYLYNTSDYSSLVASSGQSGAAVISITLADTDFGGIALVADRWVGDLQGYGSLRLTKIRLYGNGPVGPEYSSYPTNGSTIDIGSTTPTATVTSANALTVSNAGGASSELAISEAAVTGTNAGDFTVNTSLPRLLASTESVAISISCTPGTFGARTATLTIFSDDLDESEVTYTLTCYGTEEIIETWTKPISGFQHDFDLKVAKLPSPFTSLGSSTAHTAVIDYSYAPGATVHAIHAATVNSVTTLGLGCENRVLNNFWLEGWKACASVDQYANYIWVGDLPAAIVDWLIPSVTQIGVPIRWLGYEGAYLVKATDEAGLQYWYVVANPKVKSGDALQPGCGLGESLSILGYSDLSQGKNEPSPMSQGWTIVQVRNDADIPVDFIANLIEEPNGSLCVNSVSACPLVHNPTFSMNHVGDIQPDGWSFESDVTGQGPRGSSEGVEPSGRIISLPMNLSASTQYIIETRYKKKQFYGEPPYGFRIELGSSDPIDIIDNDPYSPGELTYRSEPTTYTADLDGLYRLTLSMFEDGQKSNVVVRFVCVSEDGAQAPAPSGNCIVLDPNFEQPGDTTPWSGSAAPDRFHYPPYGIVVLQDAANVSQSITLNPKSGADQDYKIWVEWRRQGAPISGHETSLIWAFGSVDSGTFGPSTVQSWQTDSDTFTVTTATTANLMLTADGEEAAQISRVCVTTADGTLPPGYDPPVRDSACLVCAYAPTGDLTTDFSEYVYWLNCKMEQMWSCNIRGIIYSIYYGIVDILTFLGFMRLWFSATIASGIAWTNSNLLVFSYWLGSQFTNLGITFQNALTSLRSFTMITSSGAGFWDAIVAIANAISGMVNDLVTGIGAPIIALLQQIVSGLFGLVAGVFGLIGTLLTLLFTWIQVQAGLLIGMITGIISALFTAFNTASVTIPPGAPTCSTPGTLLYYPCLGFYVLDNTIFSGPVVYIFPVFMGIMAWRVLLWAMHRVKSTFMAG